MTEVNIPFDSYTIYTDGACKGNPGPSAIGVVIMSPTDETLAQISELIGNATNNEAEYKALIRGLEEAIFLKLDIITWVSDSELLVNQWNGAYAIRAANLIPLYNQAKKLAEGFTRFKAVHTLRWGNQLADSLANQAFKNKK